MSTASAVRSRPDDSTDPGLTVLTAAELHRLGRSRGEIRAQLEAHRWQRVGRALVLHNAQLHPTEHARVALANAGPRSVLTAFSAARACGLRGWERPWTDVLVPAGARVRRPRGVDIRVHYTGAWGEVRTVGERPVQRVEAALVRAAATVASPRTACGLLAAAVQQSVTTSDLLVSELTRARRTRHRALLLAASSDIGQGAQALSEIDFVRLCRRHGLPEPVRQAVRIEPNGRRRYLDAEWLSRDGTRVVVEIDGALHLVAQRWWADQLRQNELVIGGDRVLRFPSVVLRCEEGVVVDQLRRALAA